MSSIEVVFNVGHLPVMLTSIKVILVLSKPQGKVVTHSQELVWWRILMVECVTIVGPICT